MDKTAMDKTARGKTARDKTAKDKTAKDKTARDKTAMANQAAANGAATNARTVTNANPKAKDNPLAKLTANRTADAPMRDVPREPTLAAASIMIAERPPC
ncbi:MAG: hypothetical protein RLZZ282_189 [Verrucomicrobiota bacterium]